MTKEEILEKSRNELGEKDVFDLEVQKKAASVAYFSSFGLCLFVSLLNWIFTKHISVQCWIIFFGMLSIAFFVKFFKMKKFHELFVALVYFLIFTALVVLLCLQLTGMLPGAAE